MVAVLAQPEGKTMALTKLIPLIPKIPGYADKVVKVTRELYKKSPWQFRTPTKEQLKLIRAGKLKPQTFSEKRLKMELEKAFKPGGAADAPYASVDPSGKVISNFKRFSKTIKDSPKKARGGRIKKTYARGGGIRKPKGS